MVTLEVNKDVGVGPGKSSTFPHPPEKFNRFCAGGTSPIEVIGVADKYEEEIALGQWR
ncbi:hypothetical protein [Maribacter sp. 2-571]|uniref:hypothetical protein n=1 Tax=Maribacter sp. 2-571 TaxID=3417569 RepID=UPI003D34B75D